ncbi:MAG TPA: hypothetical protein PLE30_07415 [Candidatus Kapabacteria bacterium]|nr:hypothetical protein [Candidatus Kapabacteria bacterium]
MKKTVIFLFLLSSHLIFSQGGSNYSIIGIGDINYDVNASYSGLAGTSIAFPAETSINFRNPAMWSLVNSTRLQAGYKFSQHINSNSSDNSVWQNNANLTGFSALFAIDTNHGISASIGIVPFTSINYLTSTKINQNINGMDLIGTNTYQGKGGITQAYLGLSTKIVDEIAIGATIYTNFGKVNNSLTTAFTNDPYLFEYSNLKDDYFSGIGYKAGLLIKPFANLSIGYFVDYNKQLQVESSYIFSSPLIGDTSFSRSNDYEFPISQGFGLSYLSGVFLFGADFSFQDFTNFQFNKGSNSSFTDSWQFSFGVNRFGNNSINAKTLDKVSYKFGVAARKLYYTVYDNNIMEYALNVGALIPFSESFNTDIGISFGSRTSAQAGMLSEYFMKFSVDLSIGEVWFIPFKREY